MGCKALPTCTTDGVDDSEVDWVTPDELIAAALKLRDLVKAGDSRIEVVIESYSAEANETDPISEELMRDLADVKAIAEWAKIQGADKMTLAVGW